MILLLAAFTSTSFGIYYYSENLKALLIDLIVKKSRIMLEHELKQKYLIDLASSNLKHLTVEYVLKSERVVATTAGLVEHMCTMEQTHDVSQDLLIKSLMSPGMQAKINSVFEYQALSRYFTEYVTRRIDLDSFLRMINLKK